MIYLAGILYGALVEPWFLELSKWKKFKADLGHSDLLPVYESNCQNADISRNTEQVLVRFSHNVLQIHIESF